MDQYRNGPLWLSIIIMALYDVLVELCKYEELKKELVRDRHINGKLQMDPALPSNL